MIDTGSNKCEEYKPARNNEIVNCGTCQNWLWDDVRCKVENKLIDYRTAICHGDTVPYRRPRR
jgi:hypothetical protein